MDIAAIVSKQREYYSSGATRPVEFRKESLRLLKNAIKARENEISAALYADLGKTEMEAYMTEIGLVYDEIKYDMKHLPTWAADKSIKAPLTQFPASCRVLSEPYGVALIMAPWNYPFMLNMDPLIGALMAGNCAVVKPSAYSPATSRIIAEMIADTFDPQYVAVIEGGRQENIELLKQKFDYIFFTGSVGVGKTVMAAAANNLTPVTLELGGKSPVIVEKSAAVGHAARRIAFGKCINTGQTCVAPDYLLIDNSVRNEFIDSYRTALEGFYPGGDYAQMPHIVNRKHFERLCGLLEGENIVIGGKTDPEKLWIEPTLIDGTDWDSPIMSEEIFGPILPVIGYDNIDEALSMIKSRPKPLAFYLFTSEAGTEERIMNELSFGGGCVNDVLVHLAAPNLAFGGVGESGMGSYHGKNSFNTFTHYKSIMKKHPKDELPLKYMPFSDAKLSIVKKVLN